MDTLRRRNPFKNTDAHDGEDTNLILDEQEQEEVLDDLRKQSTETAEDFYMFLQVFLGIFIFFQLWFLVSPREATPFHILHPYVKTPLPPLIPMSALFSLVALTVLLNVVLYLPEHLTLPRVIRSGIRQIVSCLPRNSQVLVNSFIPLSKIWSIGLLSIAPLLSIIFVADVPQIIWWLFPVLVMGTVVLSISWIEDTNVQIDRLEKMKYEAKGA
ncbi:hypothetical protein M422DRAFT_24493 [Sphaerobolus stellatus SS14]|nr:hypothetical protein M422DRAFT_24493 [Sphaerobolus stellatus SS14]